MYRTSIFPLIVALAVASIATSRATAATIDVTPSNMNGWTLNTFDDTGAIANTGGTAALVYGPGTPPLGVGRRSWRRQQAAATVPRRSRPNPSTERR